MNKILLILSVMFFCSASFAGVYLEPPMEFYDTPVKTALDIVFMKVKDFSYSIETKSDANAEKVYLKIGKKMDFELVLWLMLAPKGLIFEKDKDAIYHIREMKPGDKFVLSEETRIEIRKELEKKSDEPLPDIEEVDFDKTPVKTAVDSVFKKAGNFSYSIELEPEKAAETVTISLAKKIKLDAVLKLILTPKDLCFLKDDFGVFHIRAISEGGNPYDLLDAKEEKEKLRFLELAKKIPEIRGPLKFQGLPVETAIKKLFAAAGRAYKIVVKDIINYGGVNYSIDQKELLDEVLKKVLEPKGLDFNKDDFGTYYIKKKGAKMMLFSYEGRYEYGTVEFRGLVDNIKGMLSNEGRLEINSANKQIVIVDDPKVFAEIEKAVNEKKKK